MTLATFTVHWLTAVRPLVRPTTWQNYRWASRHLLPLLGTTALDALTRPAVRVVAEQLRTRLQPGSQRLVLQVLRTMLQSAVEDGVLPLNVASRPGRYLRVETMPRAALFGADCKRVLDAAATVAPHAFPLLLFLARTGARLGEALGLEWQHVDLDGRVALICQQTWPRGRIGPTKSGRSHVVDLSAHLTLVLRNHRLVTPGRWCFPGSRGYPHHRATVRHWFRRSLEAAGVANDRFSLHSFRHGFASVLLARGEPLAYVQRALAHRDPKLTATLYGAALPNRRPSAVDGLDTQ